MDTGIEGMTTYEINQKIVFSTSFTFNKKYFITFLL